MVAHDPTTIRPVPLAEAVKNIRTVPLDSDTVQTARDLGISLGD
jgi:6-phosphofructokinase 1